MVAADKVGQAAGGGRPRRHVGGGAREGRGEEGAVELRGVVAVRADLGAGEVEGEDGVGQTLGEGDVDDPGQGRHIEGCLAKLKAAPADGIRVNGTSCQATAAREFIANGCACSLRLGGCVCLSESSWTVTVPDRPIAHDFTLSPGRSSAILTPILAWPPQSLHSPQELAHAERCEWMSEDHRKTHLNRVQFRAAVGGFGDRKLKYPHPKQNTRSPLGRAETTCSRRRGAH